MSPLRTLAWAALGLGLAVPASAQVEAITLTGMTITRHDVLPNIDPDLAAPCCAQLVFESGSDDDFVYIDADFAVAWSEELDRINISSRDIGLQLPTEAEPRQAWARFNYFPELERGGNSLNARRPRDWPEENAGAYLNLVFQVPAGTTQAELLIGEGAEAMRIPVTIPGEVSELPSMASFFDVKVTNFAIMPELTTEDRLSREEIAGRVVQTIGQLMRLDVEIVPSVNLRTDSEPGENAVFFYNTAFSLIGPEGLPLVNIGRAVNSSIRNDFSLSSNWDGDEPPTIEMTIFFIGSGEPGDYRLFFYDEEVGAAALN